MAAQQMSKKDQHVYVIEFESGRIKVGRSRNVKQRTGQIASIAAAFDESIARTWSSDVHSQAIENEEAMISFCSKRGMQSAREYFTGIKFDDVVAFAQSLPAYVNPKLLEEEIIRAERVSDGLIKVSTPLNFSLGFLWGEKESSSLEQISWKSAIETAELCEDLIWEEGGSGYIFDHDLSGMNGTSLFVLAVAVYLNGKTSEQHNAFVSEISKALDLDLGKRADAIGVLYEVANAETKRLAAEYQSANANRF